MKRFFNVISLLLIITTLFAVAGCAGNLDPAADGRICCFCPDTYDILAGESKDVVFTAHIEANFKPENLELYENDVVISKMYDDGTNGDKNPDDDVYTCTVTLSQSERCTLEYYAAYSEVLSKSVEISYYKELSSKELEKLSETLADIDASADLDTALDVIKNSPDIESYEVNEEDNSVTYTTIYGVSGYWSITDSTSKAAGSNSVPVENGINYTSATLNATKITSAPFMASPSVGVIRPYRGSQFRYDDFMDAGTLIADTLGGTVDVVDDGAANLDVFKNLGDYDITLIDSHGAYTYERPYICTGASLNREEVLQDLVNGFEGDYVSKRIIVVGGNRLAIGPGFFDKYYDDNSLKGSLIYLGTCSGMRDNKLAQSLINKGATSVAGYTQTVEIDYCNETLFECFINSMLLSESTLSQGVESAVAVYGPRVRGEENAELVFSGSADFSFYKHGGSGASTENTPPTASVPVTPPQSDAVYVTDFMIEEEMLMNIGELSLIEPEFTPAEADSYTISWTSSNTDVATVSPSGEAGIVSTHSLGTTEITAELVSGDRKLIRTTTVRVTPKARDTVLVLDISGSMSGEALTEMKEAAIQFCNDLLKDEYNNRVGLVFFSSGTITYELTDDLYYLTEVIENIDCGGLTNMYAGLEAANDMMENYSREEAIKNVVVMADGVPNEGATSSSDSSVGNSTTGEKYSYYFPYTNAIVDLATDMMQDYNLYSLGFFHSMYGDEVTFVSEFMEQLTNMEDGYHQVDEAEDLQFAFGDITEEISSGSKIIINIACPVDVMVRYGSETLSSAEGDFNDTTSFGKLQLLGKNKDKKVVALDADKVYDIELLGTDEGTMNYSVNYFDNSEKIVDYRAFENVPISKTTVITSSTDNSVDDVELEVDMDGDSVIDIIYSAASNSTATITMDNRKGDELPLWAIILIACGALLVIGGVLAAILITNSVKRRRNTAPAETYNYPLPEVAPAADAYEQPNLQHEEIITEDDAPGFKPDSLRYGAISVETGSMGGFRVPVEEGQIINIGTGGKYSHLVLDYKEYPNVSRLHCTVSYKDGMYFVVDCSTNGTYLNDGRRLIKGKRTPINPQSILMLANNKCMLFLD